MRKGVIYLVAVVLGGCVSPHAVLENDKGEQIVCQAQGFGLISGTMANNRYEECVTTAQMQGYKIKGSPQ